MVSNELTHLEKKALLDFLKVYISEYTLSVYDSQTIKKLFLAYLKLQIEEDRQQEAMSHTD